MRWPFTYIFPLTGATIEILACGEMTTGLARLSAMAFSAKKQLSAVNNVIEK